MLHPLLQSLTGGDRRSIGAACTVAARVLDRPELLGVLFEGLRTADPVLRMRCADALEKVTARSPQLLAPYKESLLGELSQDPQQEVRWHVAPMLARLPLSGAEEEQAVGLLLGYTQDRSSIVKTMAMQALADIALRSRHRLPDVRRHIEELCATGTPAMKARGRKLMRALAAARSG